MRESRVSEIFDEFNDNTDCDVYGTIITMFLNGNKYNIRNDGVTFIETDDQTPRDDTVYYLHGYMGFDYQNLKYDQIEETFQLTAINLLQELDELND